MKEIIRKIWKVENLYILLIILSLSLVVYIQYEHNASVKERNTILNTGLSREQEETIVEEQSKYEDIELSDLSEYYLEGDQEIQEVKKGMPYLVIPKLDIKTPIIKGTSDYSLSIGVGHFTYSSEMGGEGNFALAGHSSTVYNCVLNGLETLEKLDKIECYDEEGNRYDYYVTDYYKTDPSNVGVTYDTEESIITLVTCTDGGRNRWIVHGKLLDEEGLKNYKETMDSDKKDSYMLKVEEVLKTGLAEYMQSIKKESTTKVIKEVVYKTLKERDSTVTNMSKEGYIKEEVKRNKNLVNYNIGISSIRSIIKE